MIAAIDCDLHKLYYVDELGNTVRGVDGADLVANILQNGFAKPDMILFEIASAVDYTKGKNPNVAYHKRRWTIFNAAMAVSLGVGFAQSRIPFLVAPSSEWTNGYNLKTRHEIAGCKMKQKDEREAECMIYMYRINPAKWVSLDNYLTAL